MKVMVTGATGYIGGHTTAALVAAGHEVVALVRSVERLEAMIGKIGEGRVALAGGLPREREP